MPNPNTTWADGLAGFTRRGVLGSLAMLPLLASCGTVGGSNSSKLRLGYLRTIGPNVDLSVDAEAIKSAGIEIFPFENGNEILEALLADAIDIGETGEVQPVFAQSAGHPVKVVASTEPATLTSMLVPGSSPMKTIADLKGHRVAFTDGTNGHLLVVNGLASVGLKQSDVQQISLQGGDLLSALDGGQVDALVMAAPITFALVAKGARVLFDNRGLMHSSFYYVASDKLIRDKPDAIRTFIRATSQHLRWSSANPEKFSAIVQQEMSLSADAAQSFLQVLPKKLAPVGTGAVAEYNQRMADVFSAQRLIPSRIDARLGIDGSFDKVLSA